MKTLLAALLLTLLALPTHSYAYLGHASLGDRLFTKTCQITSAAAATAVPCLLASTVTGELTPYLTDFIVSVSGATPWATTANCFIKDSSASPSTIVTIAVSALTANATVLRSTAGVTLGASLLAGTGAVKGNGLQLVCDANGTGSTLNVTLVGALK